MFRRAVPVAREPGLPSAVLAGRRRRTARASHAIAAVGAMAKQQSPTLVTFQAGPRGASPRIRLPTNPSTISWSESACAAGGARLVVRKRTRSAP